VPDNDIQWLEPKDIAMEDLLARGLQSNHSNHVNALFADGSVGKIRKDIDAKTLRALLTISGGETVDPRIWQLKQTR
jgi:prepilin-type processing-associated H-X9-DG protein